MRQVVQCERQLLLECGVVGVLEDDRVRVDMDAITVDFGALGLDECDALLHCCSVVLDVGLMNGRSPTYATSSSRFEGLSCGPRHAMSHSHDRTSSVSPQRRHTSMVL